MKTRLRTIIAPNGNYFDALMFVCPGCKAGGPEHYDAIHLLAVNADSDIGQPSWDWNGDLDAPTLSPSILSNGYSRCHSFLRDGIFEFLNDSDHPFAGQNIPIPDLPQWAKDLDEEGDEQND